MDDRTTIHTDHDSTKSCSETDSIITVQPEDVLCGKGKYSFNHPGNVDFRQIISNDAGSYSECNSSIDRLSVVEAVIDRIERVNGGRFLRQNQITGNWIPMNQRQIQDKIMNAFRDITKRVPTTSKSAPTKGKRKSTPPCARSPGNKGNIAEDFAATPSAQQLLKNQSLLKEAHDKDKNSVGEGWESQHQLQVLRGDFQARTDDKSHPAGAACLPGAATVFGQHPDLPISSLLPRFIGTGATSFFQQPATATISLPTGETTTQASISVQSNANLAAPAVAASDANITTAPTRNHSAKLKKNDPTELPEGVTDDRHFSLKAFERR